MLIMSFRLIIFFTILLCFTKVNFGQNFSFPFTKKSDIEFTVKELEFIENKNQWNSNVKYKAVHNLGNFWFEKDRVTIDIHCPKGLDEFFGFKFLSEEEKARSQFNGIVNSHAFNMRFVNSNPNVNVTGRGVLPYYNNYFLGKDSSLWATNVAIYDEIMYESLYNGIDLRFYSYKGKLKYDYIVSVGANPSEIQIEFTGLNEVKIRNNNLIFETSVNSIKQLQPFAYQIIDGYIVEVECRFKLRNDRLTYVFPNSYNKNYELIIDPILIFSSYSGSSADNWGYTATYDQNGNLYAGGVAFGFGYPTTLGAYQTSMVGGVCDIVVSKFNSTGSSLIFSTYLGGSASEVPHSLIVDKQNQLYVFGTTGSANFPTAGNPFDNTFNGGTLYSLTSIIQFNNGSDIIVSKFNAQGTQLLASTFLGGTGNDGLNMFTPLRHNYADDCRGEILLDENENIFIASSTASTNFPVTPGSFQTVYGGGSLDGVIVKLDNSLSNIIWASYLGGSGIDAVYSIAIDNNNTVVVGGGTTSNNFITTPNSIRPTYQGGSSDGFVTKISPLGNSVLNSTYWGTNVYDQVYFVDIDKQNNIYTLGQTLHSGSNMRFNALWFNPGGGVFISKFRPNLDSLFWSTTFGSTPGAINISPTAFMVDKCNSIYLSGWGSNSLAGTIGTSGLPITANAMQTTTDNEDYYFLVMRDDASALVYATFFGGTSREHVDGGTSRFDKMGRIYQAVCAGCGGIDDFPTTPGAWSNTNNSSNCNIGVIKIDFNIPVIVAEFNTNAPVCLPNTVNFINTSNSPNPGSTICFWDFGDGNTSNNCNPSHLYANSGLYNVKLIMSDLNSCNLADTIIKQVLVLSNSSDTLPKVQMCKGEVQQIGIPPYVGFGLNYTWQPTTGLSNPNITNPMCSATSNILYSLLVSSSTCTDTLFQLVEVIDIYIDAGNDTLICSVNFTLKVDSVSGSPIYNYVWSSNNLFTDTLNTSINNDFANVVISAPTWYYVKVFYQNCFAIDSIFIDFVAFNSNLTTISPKCFGDCTGSLTVNPTGGTPPYTFLWNNSQTSQTISGLCAGNYSVLITDALNCQTISSFVLTQPDSIHITLSPTDVNCEASCYGNIVSTVSGGTLPYQYLWSNGQTNSSVFDLCVGTYFLTVTDSNSCISINSTNVIVSDIFDSIYVWAEEDTIFEGQSTWLHATSFPGLTYTWTPSNWLSSPFNSSTLATPPPGTHTYFITVTDGQGCYFNDSLKIHVSDVLCYEPYIFVPNAFTPDGDNFNDVFYVRGIFIDEMELLIFNRWGELVFQTNDKNRGWDGRHKGVLVEPDVFTYLLKIKCFDKVEFTKSGNITLIR